MEKALIFCVDSLKGFKETINAVYPYPFAKIQKCIVHQIRASIKYIPHKDKKTFVADLKKIYRAINEDVATNKLISLKEKWGSKFPNAVSSWEDLITFFAFPDFIRKIMYTTNVIESLNSQFRKVTKNKKIFPTDDSLLKILYLATEKVAKKWTRKYPNWDLVINQLKILFAEILEKSA